MGTFAAGPVHIPTCLLICPAILPSTHPSTTHHPPVRPPAGRGLDGQQRGRRGRGERPCVPCSQWAGSWAPAFLLGCVRPARPALGRLCWPGLGCEGPGGSGRRVAEPRGPSRGDVGVGAGPGREQLCASYFLR